MGSSLPKPVTTKVMERKGNQLFRVGVSCMNGMRERMEDAHAIEMHDTWGFFGVFDGHVGPEAAEFIARRWPEVLRGETIPISDARMKQISLDLDEEFLAKESEDGSTGTFLIARKLSSGRYTLQVGNVGDSRVIVGKGGRACPVTDDHKPNNHGERTRIEEAGGSVSNGRVDGKLAVSRAYGDIEYKNSDSNLTHKVIAVPDIVHIDCGPEDFVLLSCDGVFESNFTNEEVIAFVTAKLNETNDLSEIASAVCTEALDRGSHDNISCMLLQLVDGSDYANLPPEKQHEVVHGPYSCPLSLPFRNAYIGTLAPLEIEVHVAVEQRYDFVLSHLPKRIAETKTEGETCDLETLNDSELRKMIAGKRLVALPELIKFTRSQMLKLCEDNPPNIPDDIAEMQAELQMMVVNDEAPPPKVFILSFRFHNNRPIQYQQQYQPMAGITRSYRVV
eukprot:TRINITY_DN1536_c0_g1_i5.p1 TRINITY_DN1536_c0_g1~~TRINITY_DN1536_c0_g1_i5.p1  ORF type:complete len:448 (+),score=105.59 TRINITY_DN1536_c0_g1_i5:78-1421(+)